jgi:hypothetical protein
MNRFGKWNWKVLLALAVGGFTVGFCLGQTRGVWTERVSVTDSGYSFWRVHDDASHVLCYALMPDVGDTKGRGSSVSCVRLDK